MSAPTLPAVAPVEADVLLGESVAAAYLDCGERKPDPMDELLRLAGVVAGLDEPIGAGLLSDCGTGRFDLGGAR